jgi:hypothetical protein
MSSRWVTGVLQGRIGPLGGQRVLLGCANPLRVLATASSDADGSFILDAGAGPIPAGLGVLAQIRSPYLGAAWAAIGDDPAPIELDVTAPIHRLTVEIDGAPTDRSLDLFVDPVSINDVPDDVMPLLLRQSDAVMDDHFASREVGKRADFEVLTGAYRVGALSVYDEPPSVREPADLWTGSARDDAGGPLPGGGWIGYTVRVDRDRRVRLMIEPVVR